MENFNLLPLIAEIDVLRIELGYGRWACLQPWCDEPSPKDASEDALERLAERLCCLLADTPTHEQSR